MNDDDLVKNLKSSIDESSSTPDSVTRASKSIYQDQYDQAAVDNFIKNQGARIKYSHRIFVLTVGWLSSVLLIVIAVGLKWLVLSDPVLLALLGTTTVTALGFFVIVVRYLFNERKST